VVDKLPMSGPGKVDRSALIRQDREAAAFKHIQAPGACSLHDAKLRRQG